MDHERLDFGAAPGRSPRPHAGVRRTAPETPLRVRLLFRLLIAAVALLGASRLNAAALLDLAPLFTRITRPVSIPVDLANGTMLVRATVNGSGPFNFVVDTGCSCSVISPAVALASDARQMDASPLLGVIDGFGNTSTVQQVLLESVELGGVRFEGVIAGVAPLDLQSRVTGLRIDGLLAYSVFSELFLTLDFPNRRLALSPDWPLNLPPIRAELNLTEHEAVPFVDVDVQGQSHEMMLDTGANGSLQLDRAAASALDWKVAPRPAGLVAVLDGTGRESLGRLAGAITLGGVRQIEPVVSVGGGYPRIGTGFCQSLCLVFSRTQNKLWVCAPTDVPIPSPPKRSLGLSLLADASGWRVAGTIPGSPAEKARLVRGDLITSIEHTPAQNWTRDAIQQQIDHRQVVTLAVTNATGAHDLALPVWLLVP